MSLTKEIVTSKIEVVNLENTPVVQVRELTRISEDGTVISESFHRYTLNQGADISFQPAIVQSVCNAVWTE